MVGSTNQFYYTMERVCSPVQCSNCNQTHTNLRGSGVLDCYLITIKRSGRSKLRVFDHVRSIPVPDSLKEQKKLRNQIWEDFESIKVENDLDRDEIAAQKSPKGQLRTKAPIPWLSWTAADGRHGQTRNKNNFFTVWEQTIEIDAKTRPLWLSTVLVQSHQFDDSESIQSNCSG